MNTDSKFKLKDIDWPEFGQGAPITYAESATANEYQARIDNTLSRMEALGLTSLVICGDREHFANITYLTGLDPRFEEAVLVVNRTGSPLMIVGLECDGYLPVSPLYRAGKLRSALYPTFSLPGTPAKGSRLIRDIFAGEGIGQGSMVGTVGIKSYMDVEGNGGIYALDVPSYIADTLRTLAGYDNVTNAAGIFADSDTGLRSTCSPSEIACFEYTNVLASEGMRRMHFGLKEGMTDYDLAKYVEYNGEPLGCHMTLAVGRDTPGLCGPAGKTIRRGDTISWNICYWGSNICRVGWAAASDGDLPVEAKAYVQEFAGAYFEAACQWLGMLRVGARAGDFAALIETKLPYEKFGILLNPGHLIHLEEWMSSPFFKGSEIKLHSGMMVQLDIIPSSKTYFSARMEEGFVLADAALRAGLKASYPGCYDRCVKRRAFMKDVLGIPLHEDVLPLSNMPCIVLPYLLRPNTVFSM